MANINQTYLLGNLTKDPELKYTNEGMAIAEMGLAVNKRWRDQNGEENISVDYFNITAWNSLAENCSSTLKKGDRILVGGHLNLRSWENKEGKKYSLININADVIALSLEFNSLNNNRTTGNGNDVAGKIIDKKQAKNSTKKSEGSKSENKENSDEREEDSGPPEAEI
jgi:single-strand DNA-binding protein